MKGWADGKVTGRNSVAAESASSCDGGGGGGIVVPGPGCQRWCLQLVHAGVAAGSSSSCLEGCDNELVQKCIVLILRAPLWCNGPTCLVAVFGSPTSTPLYTEYLNT